MEINKIYIFLKHWLALPPHGLAGQACGPSVAPLAWPSSPRSFIVGEKIISEILFRLDVVSHASAISHSRNMQPKSQKKREKREKGQCYYPFPHSCFKVAPDSFNLSLGLRIKCSAEGQMSSHSFLKTFPEF